MCRGWDWCMVLCAVDWIRAHWLKTGLSGAGLSLGIKAVLVMRRRLYIWVLGRLKQTENEIRLNLHSANAGTNYLPEKYISDKNKLPKFLIRWARDWDFRQKNYPFK